MIWICEEMMLLFKKKKEKKLLQRVAYRLTDIIRGISVIVLLVVIVVVCRFNYPFGRGTNGILLLLFPNTDMFVNAVGMWTYGTLQISSMSDRTHTHLIVHHQHQCDLHQH